MILINYYINLKNIYIYLNDNVSFTIYVQKICQQKRMAGRYLIIKNVLNHKNIIIYMAMFWSSDIFFGKKWEIFFSMVQYNTTIFDVQSHIPVLL